MSNESEFGREEFVKFGCSRSNGDVSSKTKNRGLKFGQFRFAKANFYERVYARNLLKA